MDPEELLKDQLLESLTQNTESLNKRNFVVLKSINTCEVVGPVPNFWPVELAMSAFSLELGLRNSYWTLIDTIQTPVGYACIANETEAETALPPPGSPLFKPEHRDYRRILGNIRRFIEAFVEPCKGQYFGVFVMPEDLLALEGSLLWLLQNTEYSGAEERIEFEGFFRNLKICKLTLLLLQLSRVASARDMAYNPTMLTYRHFEGGAARVLNEGCFDYKNEITCPFHNQEPQSFKMNMCVRNDVLRRVYLLMKEVVPHLGLTVRTGHLIKHFTQTGNGRLPPYHCKSDREQDIDISLPKKEDEWQSNSWVTSSSGALEVESSTRASGQEQQQHFGFAWGRQQATVSGSGPPELVDDKNFPSLAGPGSSGDVPVAAAATDWGKSTDGTENGPDSLVKSVSDPWGGPR